MASNTTNPTEYQDEQRVREDERARMADHTQAVYDGQMADDPVAEPVNRPAARPMERPMTQPVAQPMAPAYAAPMMGATADATQVIEADDRIRWGPVWGGTLTTFATFIVLEFLGVGLGLISPTNGAVVGASGVSTLIAALIAFLVGGWVAESTSIARGFGARLLTGFMVWALVTTLILAASLLGLGTLFGQLGSVAGQVSISARSVSGGQAGTITQAAGWGAFVWLVISAILAMIGSLIGFPRRALVARRHRY